MSSTATPTRGRRGRRAPQEGPRASLKQLLPLLFEHRRVLVIVVILSIFGAIATLAQPLLVGLLIGRVQAGEPLGMIVWGVFALVVAASVISGFQHFLLQRTGTAVVYSSRRKLIGRILHLPIGEFDARRTGDLVSRVGTDTTLLYAVLTQGLADAVGNSLVFVGALVAMALIDPALLGLIVLVIGLSIGGVTLLSGRIRTATRDQQEKVGELASGVERSVGSIRTVRAAGASDREEAAISALAEEAYDQGVRIAKVSALIVPIAGIALQLSLLVVLGVGGLRVASGAITVAALVTFIMFLFLLIAPLGSTFGAITSVNQALGALGRIQEILDLPTETQGDAALATRVRDTDDRHAGSPGAAIHQLRHTLATQAINRGMSLEAIAALLGHHDLSMTMVYARIADRTVADEYFAVTEKVEALYVASQPAVLPADAAGPAMQALRAAATKRLLGNGYCTRPLELDCSYETICESCTMFVTTIEYRPTLQAQRDDADAKGQTGRRDAYEALLKRLDPTPA